MTLLSCDFPPEEQWIIHWRGRDDVAWKADSVVVEVFTDKGVVGIGGCSPYGGPEAIKEFAEQIIRPAITGRNPFDVQGVPEMPVLPGCSFT